MASTTSTSSLKAIARLAQQLSPADKQELIAILQGMLEAESDREPSPSPLPFRYRGPKGGSGSFEEKIINGCGPYLYLRYWSGGKHRSVYLGKVTSSDS